MSHCSTVTEKKTETCTQTVKTHLLGGMFFLHHMIKSYIFRMVFHLGTKKLNQ